MTETRFQSTVQKVPTSFGNLYVHLDSDAAGRPAKMRFSTPGKAGNTELEGVIRALGTAASDLIDEAWHEAGGG